MISRRRGPTRDLRETRPRINPPDGRGGTVRDTITPMKAREKLLLLFHAILVFGVCLWVLQQHIASARQERSESAAEVTHTLFLKTADDQLALDDRELDEVLAIEKDRRPDHGATLQAQATLNRDLSAWQLAQKTQASPSTKDSHLILGICHIQRR